MPAEEFLFDPRVVKINAPTRIFNLKNFKEFKLDQIIITLLRQISNRLETSSSSSVK